MAKAKAVKSQMVYVFISMVSNTPENVNYVENENEWEWDWWDRDR